MQRIKMDESKAKLIACSSYKANKKLIFLSSLFSTNNKEPIIKELKNNLLLISVRISYEILHPIYNEFPDIKKDIELLETILSLKYVKTKTLKKIDTENEARIIIYLAISAFNDLAGHLIPKIISINENEIAQVIAEQSKNIILNILTPLFKEFPNLKNELDKVQNSFGIFPC